ncbi:MAG: RnfABCDGE type electron transport complex subunit D, partial [Gemmatimonadaceae bacterium]|nr:RnfABCDGE type electron transport complex subunit D [Gemmatimonadaceae bacterium]
MSRTQAVRKFFKTPKGLLTIVLVALAAMAAPREGFDHVLPELLAAVVVAAVMDVVILRLRHPRWEFPSGAILTGLIIAMVLSPFEPWWVSAATSAIAIASKYVLRTKSANIFNPAALALVISYYAFNTGQSWWGALPELMPAAVAALFISGIFITDRVNKMPLVLAFLGVYYALFTA